MVNPTDLVALAATLATAAALVRAGQPFIEPYAKLGAELLGRLLGPGADVAGQQLADSLRDGATRDDLPGRLVQWKGENVLALLLVAGDKAAAQGVELRAVPRRFVLPLLEAAGYVDEPELRELWAQLLVNGVETEHARHPRWRIILEQISPDDARAFEVACKLADEVRVSCVSGSDRSSAWPRASSDADARLEALGLVVVGAVLGLHHEAATVPTARLPLPAMPSDVGAQFRRAVGAMTRPDREEAL